VPDTLTVEYTVQLVAVAWVQLEDDVDVVLSVDAVLSVDCVSGPVGLSVGVGGLSPPGGGGGGPPPGGGGRGGRSSMMGGFSPPWRLPWWQKKRHCDQLTTFISDLTNRRLTGIWKCGSLGNPGISHLTLQRVGNNLMIVISLSR
jgi:hypothetical protein